VLTESELSNDPQEAVGGVVYARLHAKRCIVTRFCYEADGIVPL
jgi:hypothetical protein